MTNRQQIFWSIAGALIATLFGALVTTWINKPVKQSVGQVLYWQTQSRLPEEFCKVFNKSDVDRACTQVTLVFKNPEYTELEGFEVLVDSRQTLDGPLDDDEVIEPPKTYPFVDGDILVSRKGKFIQSLRFDRFPPAAKANFGLKVHGLAWRNLDVSSNNADLVDVSDEDNLEGTGTLILGMFLGLLAIFAIGIAVTFFQWLAKK